MDSPRTVSRRRLGALKVFEVAGDGPLAVVLLHGFGADGADLVALAAETPCRSAHRWLFPEAPNPVAPEGYGRAWFPIDQERLYTAQMTGVPAEFSGEDPPGLDAAARAVEAVVLEAGIAWEKTVIGGFSQGAMVAVEVALRASRAPAGVAILSGNLLAERRWRELAARRPGVPFFQSHGRGDPILAFAGALGLERLLREAGWRGSLLAFDGGHMLGPEVVAAFGTFLDELSAARP